ncbi:hypothetical protein EJ071_19370 [Mesorhizobium sp. M1B.F.Ca.ET.045.04.1.1]|nr:hypothetical protein EJ071_19370 [Mesorhizobium sp. M1B.F.Ca.ET.045.04.1.1]
MKRLLIAVAIATLLPAAAMADIRLCTGSSSGNYFAAGQEIAKMAGKNLPVSVVETEGTIDNLQRLIDQPADSPTACDAMIGQPDGPVYIGRQSPAKVKKLRQVGGLHREYLHVLCSKASGVDDLGDIADGGHSLAIGEPGSGAWLIWQNIIAEDDSYAKVPVTNEGGIIALSAVASDVTTCMLVPSGLKNGTVMEADSNFGDSVVLADANDKDFNDATDITGKPLYTYVDIPSGTYPNSLQTGLFGSSVSTISWLAGVYVNTDRFTDQKQLAAFIQAVARASAGIKAEYGQ